MASADQIFDQLEARLGRLINRLESRLDQKIIVLKPITQPDTKPPQQPSTSPPVKPAVTTAKSETQKKKQKRNEKTRQQYKRRKALRVTVQEVEHVNKPRKHVVLERTKQVPWDGSHTSLQTSLQQSWGCAVIQMDGMTMVRHGTSGMPRIGIG